MIAEGGVVRAEPVLDVLEEIGRQQVVAERRRSFAQGGRQQRKAKRAAARRACRIRSTQGAQAHKAPEGPQTVGRLPEVNHRRSRPKGGSLGPLPS